MPALLDAPVGWQQHQGALKTLYEFFDQTNLILELIKSWKKYIEDHGNQAFAHVRSETDPEKLVNAIRQVCSLKDKTCLVVEKSFSSSQAVTAALKAAFESFLNVDGRQDRSAQLLALMIDLDMRKAGKKE